MSAPLWLLTVEYDPEEGSYMMVRKSLHTDRDGALLRLFDVVYEVSSCTPEQTEVLASSKREDGAEFGDVRAAGDPISYTIEPLTLEPAKISQ